MLRLGTFLAMILTVSAISCTDMGSWDLIAERLGAVAPVQGPSTRRVLVTATGVTTGSLTDFPLLVKLPSTFPYGECDPDGLDLRFYASDGVTPLAFERESWNPVGESIFWVRIPLLEPTTTFWVYLGSEDAVDGSYGPAVWTNGYVGVWHGIVSYDSSGQAIGFLDSSGRQSANYITPSYTAPLTNGDAGLGPAFVFSGGTNGLVVPGITQLTGSAPFSFEAWIDNSGMLENDRILSSPYLSLIVGNSNNFTFYLPYTITSISATTPSILTAGWKLISLSWDGSIVDFYNDLASYVGNATVSSGVPDPENTQSRITFGNTHVLPNNAAIDASMDEIRLSNVTRDDAWMKAQYRSQLGTYVSFGSAEDVP